MQKSLPDVELLHRTFDLRADGVLVRKAGIKQHRAGEPAGASHGGYVRVGIGGVQIMAHRIVWAMAHGEWPGALIDHINGDGSDNRPENLRLATTRQNLQNRGAPRHNTSGVKGVYQRPNGKWIAMIRVDGRLRSVGTYAEKEQARAAYNRAAFESFGEFARAA